MERSKTTDVLLLSVITMTGFGLFILSIPKLLYVRVAYAIMLIVYLFLQLASPAENFDSLYSEMRGIFGETILATKQFALMSFTTDNIYESEAISLMYQQFPGEYDCDKQS